MYIYLLHIYVASRTSRRREATSDAHATSTPPAWRAWVGLSCRVPGHRIYDRSGYDCSSLATRITRTHPEPFPQHHKHTYIHNTSLRHHNHAIAPCWSAATCHAVPCPCRQHGLHSVPHFFPATHAPHTRVSRNDRSSSWSPAPPDRTAPLANCTITLSSVSSWTTRAVAAAVVDARRAPRVPTCPGRHARRDGGGHGRTKWTRRTCTSTRDTPP